MDSLQRINVFWSNNLNQISEKFTPVNVLYFLLSSQLVICPTSFTAVLASAIETDLFSIICFKMFSKDFNLSNACFRTLLGDPALFSSHVNISFISFFAKQALSEAILSPSIIFCIRMLNNANLLTEVSLILLFMDFFTLNPFASNPLQYISPNYYILSASNSM